MTLLCVLFIIQDCINRCDCDAKCSDKKPDSQTIENVARASACGDLAAPLSADMPNVLLIGDSISMPPPFTPGGYGSDTKAILANAHVHTWHNGGWEAGGQASNTVKGLHCTNSSTPGNWLNFTGTYDVIHFNFGLHDLAEDTENVELDQYGENLKIIYARLAARSKHGTIPVL